MRVTAVQFRSGAASGVITKACRAWFQVISLPLPVEAYTCVPMRRLSGRSSLPAPRSTVSSRAPLPLAVSVAPVSAAPEHGMPVPSVRGIEPLPPGIAMKSVSAVLRVSTVFSTCWIRAVRSASKPFGSNRPTRTLTIARTRTSSSRE